MSGTWKKSFVHSTRQHFALCHAHSRTDGPEVTVIYAGQNLKSNASLLFTSGGSE